MAHFAIHCSLFAGNSSITERPPVPEQIPEKEDEARQNENLVDEPVRAPDIPLRSGQEHYELGHDNDNFDYRYRDRQSGCKQGVSMG